MKIQKTESQTFGARIVISKKGFTNLAKNIADSGHMGLDTSMSASINSCASSAPWALKHPVPNKNGMLPGVGYLADDMETRGNNIKGRNIAMSHIEGITSNMKGYNNLGQDSADFSMTTFPSVKLSSSTILETSAIPSEIEYGKGFLGSISKNWNLIKNTFKQIGKRNINTVNIDFPEGLRLQTTEGFNISGQAGAGASSISTGVSSYASSAAIGADNLIYHTGMDSVAGSIRNIASVENLHNTFANGFHGASADKTVASTFNSSFGFVSQTLGLKGIHEAQTLAKESSFRKFPS